MTNNIGKCERCEDNGVELVATTWAHHFGFEAPTHCQVCADILEIKSRQLPSAFAIDWNDYAELD